jgi:predicted permease
MFGRLKEGASQDAAHRDIAALTAAYASEAAEPDGFRTFTDVRVWAMTGLPPDARRAALGFMSLLFGAAVLVLLIASVNVASMLSARAIARRREMALRTALGAGRARLVRQLLTESLVLFLLGAVGGLTVALLATRALEGMRIPGDVSVSLELSPDVRVLVFALAVSLITGVAFGLAPALQAARSDIALRLRDQSAGAGTRRAFLGNALIVGQLALSLVLLVVAGLFVRALELGARMDPGFETANVATAALNTESWGYDDTKGRAFFHTLRERSEALPGVVAVSYSSFLPLTMSSNGGNIDIGGTAVLPIRLINVDAGYFDVIRIPLVAGRAFENTDDQDAPKVAVVNETLARRVWSDGSALGRTFTFADERVTIIGVARDAKYATLDEATPPFAYFPLAQRWQSTQTLMVRTVGDPEAIAPGILQAVRSIDPALPLPTLSTLQAETSIVLLPQRVAAMLTGALGGIGLLLATVGLYGIIAHATGRRTREIGLRVALGARRSDVIRMIVREGMSLAGTGVAIGLLLAAAASRLVTTYLLGVSPMDGITFAGMSALFLASALVASWLPARKAAGSDPMVVLRTD